MDAAFLARIAEHPDDDLARLVYADWLDEHGRAGDAERIRLALRLDPDRDRFDDAGINALRERVEALTPEWVGLPPGVEVKWRRGLPDTLCVPAPAFVEHGATLRERSPTTRRLVLFRLNGWGERVAACEHLRGVRDLELACWYADADAEALAASPHVADVGRLTLWAGENAEHAADVFLASPTAMRIFEYHLVSAFGDHEGWADAVTRLASESPPYSITVYDFDQELFVFAPDFYDGESFLVGKAPDGSQLFAYAWVTDPALVGWWFNADGTRREPFRLDFPPHLVLPEWKSGAEDMETRCATESLTRTLRREFINARVEITPAFIRVEKFDLPGDHLEGPVRVRDSLAEYAWGVPDDLPNEADRSVHEGGHGWEAYDWVRTRQFTFGPGQQWWCDHRGGVHST